MGYRSDVGIEFYSPEEHGKIAVVKMWLRENLPFKDWNEDAFRETEDGYRFFVSDVKWYDTYSPIENMNQAIEKFEELFCDIDPCAACEFVRIGEEDEDVERRVNGEVEYRISVSKQIQFDFE